MSGFNFSNFVSFLNGEVFDGLEKEMSQLEAMEYSQFNYRTDSYEDLICYNDFVVYSSENSDRGWDDETDDYERTIPEQALKEMKELRDKLSKVIEIMEENID